MGHGDFGDEVGGGDYALAEAVAFGAEDDGEAGLAFQFLRVEGDGVVAECHGDGGVAEGV